MDNFSNIVLETLNKAIDEYIKQIQREMNKSSKAKDLKSQKSSTKDAAQIKKDIIQARVQIFNSYTSIAKSVFKSVFDNYYGAYYDESSLMDSLSFNQLGNGIPYIIYDTSKFKFLPNKMRRENELFNFNIVQQSTAKHFSEEDWYDTGLIDNFFQDGEENDYLTNGVLDEDQQEEDMANVAIDFANFRKGNLNIKNSDFPLVKDVYKTAKEKADQEFNKQYISLIKPQLLKKYPNIKL